MTLTAASSLQHGPDIPSRPLTSLKQARQLALSLPETVEKDHHGRPSFRVGGTIFATLWDESHMNLMLDEPGIHTAVQGKPEACTEFWWGKRLGAVHVRLDRVSTDELAELLTEAWEQKAPQRPGHNIARPSQQRVHRT